MSDIPPVKTDTKKAETSLVERPKSDLTPTNQQAIIPAPIDGNSKPQPRRTPPRKPQNKEIRSLKESLSKIGKHFVITSTIVALGILMHLFLVVVLRDPGFFDFIPIRYVIDLGDLAVIVTFFAMMIRELWRSVETNEQKKTKKN